MPSCQVRLLPCLASAISEPSYTYPDRLHSEDLVNKVVPKTAVVAKG